MRRSGSLSLFSVSGWLFADLLLVLAALFIATSSTASPPPPTIPAIVERNINVPIQYINLRPGFQTDLSGQEATVTLRGPQPQIDQVGVSDVIALVDLSDFAVPGGPRDVRIAARLPSGAQVTVIQVNPISIPVIVAAIPPAPPAVPAIVERDVKVPIQYINLRPGLQTDLSGREATVTLRGALPDLDRIAGTDIVALVDLAGFADPGGPRDVGVETRLPPGSQVTVARLSPVSIPVTVAVIPPPPPPAACISVLDPGEIKILNIPVNEAGIVADQGDAQNQFLDAFRTALRQKLVERGHGETYETIQVGVVLTFGHTPANDSGRGTQLAKHINQLLHTQQQFQTAGSEDYIQQSATLGQVDFTIFVYVPKC